MKTTFRFSMNILFKNAFFITGLISTCSLPVAANSEPVIFYKAGHLVQDTRLAFQWKTDLALRGEFIPDGNRYRFEGQSLRKAGIYIEIQTLLLRNDQPIPTSVFAMYLGPNCIRQGSEMSFQYDCQIADSDSSVDSVAASSQMSNQRTARFLRVEKKDDLLHIFYMAYHKDFSSSARQIIRSSAMRDD